MDDPAAPSRPRTRPGILAAGLGAVIGGDAGVAIAAVVLTFGSEAVAELDVFAAGIGGLAAGAALGTVAGAALGVAVRRAGAVAITAVATLAVMPAALAILVGTGGLWWRRDLVALAIVQAVFLTAGMAGRSLARWIVLRGSGEAPG